MINSLYIKDFALIDELEVSFGEGLHVLTGQTGAGKSIIIGALNMVLGERADTDVIRRGADKAIAEAIISMGDDSPVHDILKQNEIDIRPELILRREIREAGSRAFINDTPVTIAILKQVGDFLVDLHGQHDHQMLLRDENHRGVIDDFDEMVQPLKNYRVAYQTMAELQKMLAMLQKRESELREKTDLFQFQVNELDEANLDPEEEEQLIAEMNLLDNAEDLDKKASAIVAIGSDDEINLIDLVNTIKINLEDIARIEPEFKSYLQEINTARISLQEMIQFTERYRNGIEHNPQRLEELRRRQSELNRLQKKYGRDIPELILYLNEIRNELNLAENFDIEISKLEKEIQNQSDVLKKCATDLHDKRIATGRRLSAEIVEALKNLDIPHGQFKVDVAWNFASNGWIEAEGRPVECAEHGCDDVRFFISTNKGEEPKPLARIASGGEVSRVMLALKSIIAREQHLPVMIFDEIDTGISGHVSEKVGRMMRTLAEHCQIIAITHQPQIASQAHRHYRVEKGESAERTVTRIVPLSADEHIREVASLMSGEEITEAALNSARELVEKSAFRN
jgi:DNA repair protein RecN (Recombination protein N)